MRDKLLASPNSANQKVTVPRLIVKENPSLSTSFRSIMHAIK